MSLLTPRLDVGTGILLVVHHQRPNPRKIVRRFVQRGVVRRLPKDQRHREGASPALHALHLNGPVHQRNKVLGDRQAQARAAVLLRRARRFLLKRPEQALLILFRHPDAGIRNDETHVHLVVLRFRLADGKADLTPRRREFDGVGKQIHQDLIDPQLVAHHPFFREGVDADREVHALGLRLIVEHDRERG